MIELPTTCPACFSGPIAEVGPDYAQCAHCNTIFARDRTTKVTYDEQYVADRYDKYPTTKQMSELRRHIVTSVIANHEGIHRNVVDPTCRRLLDVGFGNGSFIRAMQEFGWECYGNDVNRAHYPQVVRRDLPGGDREGARDTYRVVTFFDTLEHFEGLSEVRWVSHAADWLFLTFPTRPDNFFAEHQTFKHLRPGEHHFFYTPAGLEKIFSHDGVTAEVAWCGHPEDQIRGSRDGKPNTTTVALICRG